MRQVGERLVRWGILVNPRILVAWGLGWPVQAKYQIHWHRSCFYAPHFCVDFQSLCGDRVNAKRATMVTSGISDNVYWWDIRFLTTTSEPLTLNCVCSRNQRRAMADARADHMVTMLMDHHCIDGDTIFPSNSFKVTLVAFVWLLLCGGCIFRMVTGMLETHTHSSTTAAHPPLYMLTTACKNPMI